MEKLLKTGWKHSFHIIKGVHAGVVKSKEGMSDEDEESEMEKYMTENKVRFDPVG